MVLVGVSKIAGSFMSFQKPAMPSSANGLYRLPHQSRLALRVKSGNTDGPGQTGAT